MKICCKFNNQHWVVKEIGPRGATGATGPAGENIQVRSTKTVDSNTPANVTSSHEDNTTYLDFFIPQGIKGDTGAMQTVHAGTTKQLSCDESACVSDRYENDIHFLTFLFHKVLQEKRGKQEKKGTQGRHQI